MKRACLVFPLFALLVACGSPEDVSQEPSIGEAEESGGGAAAAEAAGGPEEQAVAQLNDMCPENWCAGDFQYEFLSLACEGEECTLAFRAERDGEEIQDSIRFAYDIPLVDEFGDLDAGYYERVSDALTEGWEPAQLEE